MCANACSGGRPCNTVKGLEDIIPLLLGVVGDDAVETVVTVAPLLST